MSVSVHAFATVSTFSRACNPMGVALLSPLRAFSKASSVSISPSICPAVARGAATLRSNRPKAPWHDSNCVHPRYADAVTPRRGATLSEDMPATFAIVRAILAIALQADGTQHGNARHGRAPLTGYSAILMDCWWMRKVLLSPRTWFMPLATLRVFT